MFISCQLYKSSFSDTFGVLEGAQCERGDAVDIPPYL